MFLWIFGCFIPFQLRSNSSNKSIHLKPPMPCGINFLALMLSSKVSSKLQSFLVNLTLLFVNNSSGQLFNIIIFESFPQPRFLLTWMTFLWGVRREQLVTSQCFWKRCLECLGQLKSCLGIHFSLCYWPGPVCSKGG